MNHTKLSHVSKHPKTLGRVPVMVCFALLLVATGAPAYAGLLQIDFTAVVQEQGGGAMENAFGQFVLDTAIPFPVGASGVGGVIASASFTSGDLTGTANVDSTFTIAFSGFGGGSAIPFISLVADYGPQLFVLELTNDAWFPSGDVYDVLNPALILDDLDPFDPSLIVTTQFEYFTEDSGFTVFNGGLTSLMITDLNSVREAPTLWLFVLAACAFAVTRQERTGVKSAHFSFFKL